MSIKQIFLLIMLIAYLQSQITPIMALTGTVKFFNRSKDYGFIAGDDGKDYFVHITGLMPNVTITEGDEVCFEVVEGEKGPKADKVSLCNESSLKNITVADFNLTSNTTLINESNKRWIQSVTVPTVSQNVNMALTEKGDRCGSFGNTPQKSNRNSDENGEQSKDSDDNEGNAPDT